MISVKCLETSTTIPGPTHCPASEVPAVRGIKLILWVSAKTINSFRSALFFGKATAKGSILYTEASVANKAL